MTTRTESTARTHRTVLPPPDAHSTDVEVVAINDLTDNASLAHLLTYDSVWRRLDAVVDHDEDSLFVDGRSIRATAHSTPAEIPWREDGVDIVIEATGRFRSADQARGHLDAGARTVVMSSPGKGVDGMFVMGVNHTDFDPQRHTIVSNASCTTNCLAPVAKVLHEGIGIRSGLMTTIHATWGSAPVDGNHRTCAAPGPRPSTPCRRRRGPPQRWGRSCRPRRSTQRAGRARARPHGLACRPVFTPERDTDVDEVNRLCGGRAPRRIRVHGGPDRLSDIVMDEHPRRRRLLIDRWRSAQGDRLVRQRVGLPHLLDLTAHIATQLTETPLPPERPSMQILTPAVDVAAGAPRPGSDSTSRSGRRSPTGQIIASVPTIRPREASPGRRHGAPGMPPGRGVPELSLALVAVALGGGAGSSRRLRPTPWATAPGRRSSAGRRPGRPAGEPAVRPAGDRRTRGGCVRGQPRGARGSGTCPTAGVVHCEQASVVTSRRLPPTRAASSRRRSRSATPARDPARPYAVILGGSKVSTSWASSTASSSADVLMIGGGMVFTFLKAGARRCEPRRGDQLETVRGHLQAQETGVDPPAAGHRHGGVLRPRGGALDRRGRRTRADARRCVRPGPRHRPEAARVRERGAGADGLLNVRRLRTPASPRDPRGRAGVTTAHGGRDAGRLTVVGGGDLPRPCAPWASRTRTSDTSDRRRRLARVPEGRVLPPRGAGG